MRIVTEFPREVFEEETWLTLSDGCKLAVRIWRPKDADTNPVPAILEYLPYRKRDLTATRDVQMHPYWAGHGYAGVRVDIRGSGESDGVLPDEYLQQELDDGVEVLQWLENQPWCTGDCAMIGISWGGFNGLQIAAMQPPQLKCIITLCSTDDRYADDVHHMGGCLLGDNLSWASTMFDHNACPPDPALVGDKWREMWMQRLEGSGLWLQKWLEHQRRDDYWKHGSVCEDFSAIKIPVYAVSGWADGYCNAVFRLLDGLDVPRKGLVGPWAHKYPHLGVPGPAIGFLQETLRWFDQWLKGQDTGIMDEPQVRVWLEDWVAPAPLYEERPGRWVAEERWPSPRIQARRWYLNVLALGERADPEDRMRIASPQSTGLAAGDWYAFGGEGESPIDQRSDDGRSLVFDSDPLPETLEILGAPVAELELAVDRPVAFVAVRLNDVAPDGASARVSYGLLNLCHRDGHAEPQPLEPGRRYRVRVRLNDIAYGFRAGHTIRLSVSTSYWPVAWPAPEPVRLTLYTGVSTLDLPVRLPRAEDAELAPFAEPEAARKPDLTEVAAGPFKRTVTRDLTSDVSVYEVSSDGGEFDGAAVTRIEDIDLTVGYTITKTFAIHEYDPATAHARIEQKSQHGRGDWSTAVEVTTDLTCDRDTFFLKARIRALDDGREFLVREWDETIPRKLV